MAAIYWDTKVAYNPSPLTSHPPRTPTLTEPDSPPEDVAAAETTPTTVTLTWSPPAKANGVIQRYEVLYENQTFSAVVNTSDPSATLTHLRPFSRYNVSVRAYTRLGHGNHTSDTLDLLSGEDGTLALPRAVVQLLTKKIKTS